MSALTEARGEAAIYAALFAELAAAGAAGQDGPTPTPADFHALVMPATLGQDGTAHPATASAALEQLLDRTACLLNAPAWITVSLMRTYRLPDGATLQEHLRAHPEAAAEVEIVIFVHAPVGDVEHLSADDVHQLWCEAAAAADGRNTPKHPLALLVRGWNDRPRGVRDRHVIAPALMEDRPLTRAPAVVDLAVLSPIEVVAVDGEPFATAAASMQAYRRLPARRLFSGEQAMLGFAGPRRLANLQVDPILATLAVHPLTGDERNLIRSDVHRIALLAYALTGQTIIPEAAGVQFLTGAAKTEAARKRWWQACAVIDAAHLTINESTGEWVKLGIADPDRPRRRAARTTCMVEGQRPFRALASVRGAVPSGAHGRRQARRRRDGAATSRTASHGGWPRVSPCVLAVGRPWQVRTHPRRATPGAPRSCGPRRVDPVAPRAHAGRRARARKGRLEVKRRPAIPASRRSASGHRLLHTRYQRRSTGRRHGKDRRARPRRPCPRSRLGDPRLCPFL